MSTYTTSAGYKRELPARPSTEEMIQSFADQYSISRAEAIDWLGEVNWEHFQDETPITHDLSDLSVHEPSIRAGESVSGLDKWIAEHFVTAAIDRDGKDVINAVDVDDLREFMKGKVIVTEAELQGIIRAQLKTIDSLQHPTSSGEVSNA